MGIYRSPEFAFQNTMAADTQLLSVLTGTEDPNGTEAGVFRVVDGQHARPAQIQAVGAGNIEVEIDQGLNAQPRHTRLIIPEGHNLDGWDVSVLGDSASPATTVLLAATPVTGTARIDELYADDVSSGDRFQMVRFSSSPANDLIIDLPELYLTNTVTPARGPDLKWGAGVRRNLQRFEGASGVGTSVRTGPDKQTWSLDWTLVDDIATFLTPLEQAVRPFWFLPPDDDFDWEIYQLDGNVEKRELYRSSPIGTPTLVYEASFTLVQVLG